MLKPKTFKWAAAPAAGLGGVILLYVLIQLCAIQAPLAPLDDESEFCFVRGMPAWTDLLKVDVFQLFRPVKNLLFQLFLWVGGTEMNMVRIRCVAMLIGILTLFPVYGFCARVLKSKGQAVWAAGIWMTAPTLVSCTAWLSCVNIQVMTGFAALALMAHDRAGECQTPREFLKFAALAVISFLLAGFSYEGGLALIGVFLAFDFLLRMDRLKTKRYWVLYGGYWAGCLLYLALRIHLSASGGLNGSFETGMTRWQVAVSSPGFLWEHLRSWFLPFHRFALVGSYGWGELSVGWLALLWGLVLGGVLALWLARRRMPVLVFGLSMGLIAYLPMSNLLGFKNGPYGDYYWALGSIGFAIAVTRLCSWLWTHPCERAGNLWRVVALAVIAFRAACVLESASWASLWNSHLAIYQKNIETFPEAFNAHSDLAHILCESGADQQAQGVIDTYLAKHPQFCDKFVATLAILDEHAKRIDACRAHLRRFLSEYPQNVWALSFQAYLIQTYGHDGLQAERLFQKSLSQPVTSDTAHAAALYGSFLLEQNREREAMRQFEYAVRLSPSLWEAHQNLALLYHRFGDQAKALAHLQKAKALVKHQGN